MWADSGEKGNEGVLCGLVKQPGCFFQTQASGVPSVWRAGRGQSALLAFTLQEGRTCLLGARIEGPLAL